MSKVKSDPLNKFSGFKFLYKFDINKYKLVRELDLETLIEYSYTMSGVFILYGVFRP